MQVKEAALWEHMGKRRPSGMCVKRSVTGNSLTAGAYEKSCRK